MLAVMTNQYPSIASNYWHPFIVSTINCEMLLMIANREPQNHQRLRQTCSNVPIEEKGHAVTGILSNFKAHSISLSVKPKSSLMSSFVSLASHLPFITHVAMPLIVGAPKAMRGSIMIRHDQSIKFRILIYIYQVQ